MPFFFLLMFSVLLFGFVVLTSPKLPEWAQIVGMFVAPTVAFYLDLSLIHDTFWRTEGLAMIVVGWGTYAILTISAMMIGYVARWVYHASAEEDSKSEN